MRPIFFVYILSSLSGRLYVGMTDDLPLRISQHKDGTYDSFTKQHRVNHLVYYEGLSDSHAARAREIQLKKYTRAKKNCAVHEVKSTLGRFK